MTVDEVVKRVAEIRATTTDPEAAHSMEDDLRGEVLLSIAKGECDDPASVAAVTLTTDSLDFPRWCA